MQEELNKYPIVKTLIEQYFEEFDVSFNALNPVHVEGLRAFFRSKDINITNDYNSNLKRSHKFVIYSNQVEYNGLKNYENYGEGLRETLGRAAKILEVELEPTTVI